MADFTSLPVAETIQTSNYPELRRIARAQLRYGRDPVLDTTALVHESFIRATQVESEEGRIGGSLLRFAPRIMRDVVVDSIRRRNAARHGGKCTRVEVDTGIADTGSPQREMALAVRQALADLQRIDDRLAQVVELRFFHGLTDAEISIALGITDRTVRRDWKKAQLLLAQALRG